MRNNIRFTLLLVCLIASMASMRASHFMGASITYQYLNTNQIQVDHWGYHSCMGIPATAPTTFQVVGIGGGCTAPTSTGWVLVSATDVTMLTPHINTTCGSGSLDGLRQTHYRNTYNFSGVTCTKYKLRWTDCCRNGSIVNISNSSSTGVGVEADTIRLPLLPNNNSPVWKIAPPQYALTSRVNIFDLGATDVDGDSLVYTWVQPINDLFAPSPYNLGYSLANPMGSSWSLNLNAKNGLFTLTPTPGNVGNDALAIRCSEYRNGVKIGSITREFTLTTTSSLPYYNALPSLSGPARVIGGKVIGGNIVVGPGENLCMDFVATDPNPGNGSRISWLGDLPGAALTDTFGSGPDSVTGLTPWARLCYTAPAFLRNDSVTITVVDTICQLNNMVVARYGFMIGDTALVWPGDADNNLIADAFDLLPIGLAFGNTGAARTAPSISWIGQECLPWQDTVAGGTDKKFIDGDGNGLIDANDTLPVSLNYGLTHTKAHLPVARGTTVDPPFTLILPDSASVGDTVWAPIILGDNAVGAQNVYGFAFRLNYDPTLIDSSSFWIEYSNSWVGNGSNSLDIARNHATSYMCDGALVRTTHTAVSGMGEVARAHFVIIDNIDGKRAAIDSATMHMFFSDVRVIGLDGAPIAIDVQSDSMTVYDRTVDLPRPVNAHLISVYPNPAQDLLTVKAVGSSLEAIEVLNLQGQLLLRHTEIGRERLRVDVSALAQGMYFLRVKTEGVWTSHRFAVE